MLVYQTHMLCGAGMLTHIYTIFMTQFPWENPLSMGIFNSKLLVYQRVTIGSGGLQDWWTGQSTARRWLPLFGRIETPKSSQTE